MKNLFITAMCICLMTLAGCNKASTDSQINEKAKAELAERYPDAVNVNGHPRTVTTWRNSTESLHVQPTQNMTSPYGSTAQDSGA